MTSRRDFLRLSGGCVAHVALMSACASAASRARWTAPAQPTVVTTPFARLDAIARDTWALVSTPLGGDRTTYSNGGIIAGRTGVVVVEGFYRAAGAAWLAERARELTGRWPTHVVLTHYHTDHAGGLAGYVPGAGSSGASAPRVHTTSRTRELALGGGPVAPAKDESLSRAFADITIVSAERTTVIDLGDRRLEIVPLRGHTASDLALVDRDAGVTWAGDLLWNGMFPNYVDATPSVLAASVKSLASNGSRLWVGGHGAVADVAAVARYQGLLGDLEASARKAHALGTPAADVAASYKVPPALGDWMAGKPGVERAISAWYRELGTR